MTMEEKLIDLEKRIIRLEENIITKEDGTVINRFGLQGLDIPETVGKVKQKKNG